MGDILILKSIDGNPLTEQFMKTCLDANEMFIVKKTFSSDRSSVELTFVDDERAEMISELLKTCYARSLLIKRPETEQSASIDNNSYVDDDQLSIAPSVSSNITCFSQRLASLNRRAQELKMEEKFKLPVGRGRAMDSHISYRDPVGSRENISDDETDGTIANNRAPSPVPSVANTVVSSIIGRGRRLAM